MGIFNKKTTSETDEQIIERLSELAKTNAAGMVAARSEAISIAEKAVNDYLAVAAEYRRELVKEAAQRLDRLNKLEAQKQEQEERAQLAEKDLGRALVDGNEAEQDTAEAAIAAIHEEIEKIDGRIKIFKGTAFNFDSDRLPSIEAKYWSIKDACYRADKILNAVNSAIDAHLNEYRELSYKYYSGYPSNVAAFGLVNTDFKASGCDIETLKRLSSENTTISDLVGLNVSK